MIANNHDDDKTKSFILLTSGTQVSHYTIISKIGAGGMGEVYLAEDTNLKRKVALKLLPEHLSNDDSMRARFTREAQAAAKLDHSHIVQIHEVSEFKGRPFFAMAYVEGNSLRKIIKDGKMSIEQAIDYVKQICEGLNKAHESGIVHRDIKPANIIIDKDNKVRILDFGLATISGEEKLTKTGSTLGTAGYMSPEQIEGKQVDHRSDLFSVGVIFYEMLTGRRPFEGESDAAVSHSIRTATPEPIARYKSGTTGELQQIIDKALSKDPSLRYQHADGMLADLKRLEIAPAVTGKIKSRMWLVFPLIVVIAAMVYIFISQKENQQISTETGWSNSIAVLPFHDLSPDKNQGYLCEGMADAIISRLSTIGQIKVTALSSVLRFGENPDINKIARELDVKQVLTGTIMTDNGHLRVRTRLIKADDETLLWSDSYDREMKSIFAVQDDISHAITDVLELKLSGKEIENLAASGTDNIEAYNLYLKGRYFWNKKNYKHLLTAIDYFKQAIEMEPNYALAYSGLSDALLHYIFFGISDKNIYDSLMNEATIAANKALELDNNSGEIYASLGDILLEQAGDVKDKYIEVERVLLKAIQLNPGYAPAHLWYSLLLDKMGKQEQRKKELWKAYELAPLSPAVLLRMADYYDENNNIEKAISIYKQIIEIEPSFPYSYDRLAIYYSNENQFDKAEEMLNKYAEYTPDDFFYPVLRRGWLMYYMKKYDEADSLFKQAIEFAKNRYESYQAYAAFLRNIKDYNGAKINFETALKLEPNNAYLNYQYGRLISNIMHMYEEGAKYLSKSIEGDPFDIRAYYRLIEIKGILGEVDSALALCESALKVKKDYYNIHLLYLMLLMYKQEYDKADSLAKELAASPDTNIRSWGRESIPDSYIYRGKVNEALMKMDEGIEIDLREIGNSRQLIRKYNQAGNFASSLLNQHRVALDYYKMALEYDSLLYYPSITRLYIKGFMAEALERLGLSDSAQLIMDSIYDRIGQNKTSQLSLYYELMGPVLYERGDYDSSLVLFKMVEETSGPSFLTKYNLGRSLLRAGQSQEAIIAFEKSANTFDWSRLFNPGKSVLVYYFLAKAYDHAKRESEATKMYEKFLSFWKNADEEIHWAIEAKERLAELKSSS